MSRCMFAVHRFDKTTNQCTGCGRWKPGHAPKKATTRPTAECQVCARTMALDSAGNLGHHGYQRPGWGSIVGDCYGVGFAPFPAHDALDRWARRLVEAVAETETRLADLLNATKLMKAEDQYRNGRRLSYPKLTEITKPTEPRPEGYRADPEGEALQTAWDVWTNLMKRTGREIEATIKSLKTEQARVERRIGEALATQKASA